MDNGRLVSTWEAITKDNEGDAHVHTLHKYDHTTPQEIPDFISQAAPTKITPSRRSKPTRGDQLTVFFPDAQIPFHDPRALRAAHLTVRELQPDNVVMLGDMLDFPSLSRFGSRPEWNGGVQDALDQTHRMLAQVRADAPDAKMFYVPGNHEKRLQASIIQNNAELLGIKRANAEPAWMSADERAKDIRNMEVFKVRGLLRWKHDLLHYRIEPIRVPIKPVLDTIYELGMIEPAGKPMDRIANIVDLLAKEAIYETSCEQSDQLLEIAYHLNAQRGILVL